MKQKVGRACRDGSNGVGCSILLPRTGQCSKQLKELFDPSVGKCCRKLVLEALAISNPDCVFEAPSRLIPMACVNCSCCSFCFRECKICENKSETEILTINKMLNLMGDTNDPVQQCTSSDDQFVADVSVIEANLNAVGI